jgi:predicted ATPase
LRGAALANQKRFEEGIAQMQKGLAALPATGAALGRPDLLRTLAEVYMNMGRLDDGLSALHEALIIGQENGDGQNESERHRIKGELLVRKDDLQTIEAENCFQRAIEIARGQNARSLELRATTSLARLLKSQGLREEARMMLANIYNWFTEGFDTPDLKDAKALLDELGA